jgi:hypothetical protein
MELKQFDNSQVAKIAGNNPHHDTTRTTASQLVELPIMEFRYSALIYDPKPRKMSRWIPGSRKGAPRNDEDPLVHFT